MGNNSVLGSLKRKKKKSRLMEESFLDIAMAADTPMDFYDKRDELDEVLQEVGVDEESDIQDFYKGKTVLMSGASGFIGTILLEKLLRSTDVSKVYIFFRGKKSQGLEARVQDYFAEDVFDRLRKERVNYADRVVILPADLQEDNLGMDEATRQVLAETVNVVFHVAATVKFDEHLRVAYEINCKGTETLLNMAEEMKHLDAFVHVSTAYSNCHRKYIAEKFYEPLYKHTEIKQMLESCTDLELTILNELIIKPMPNTYTLTKNSAEHMCKQRLDKLPLVVVRPSIVMPVVDEPCPLWSKGMTGLVAMYVAVGIGLMRTVYKNSNNVIDIVPGDYVVNVILGAGWDIGTRRHRAEVITRSIQNVQELDENNNPVEKNMKNFDDNENDVKGIGYENTDTSQRLAKAFHDDTYNESGDRTTSDPIYNMVSYVENPIKLGETTKLIIDNNNNSGEGCEKSLWVIHHNPTNKKWLFFIYFYLYNILPTLLFFKHLEEFSGRKSQLMKIYRKVFFLNNTIAEFTINEWKFSNGNTQRLYKMLGSNDKARFGFSMKNVHWKSYHIDLHRGLAKYALKAKVTKDLFITRVRYMRMVDTAVLSVIKVLLLYVVTSTFLCMIRAIGSRLL